jgi:hypothetical protein
MGGSVEHLRAVYDDETSQLERWPVQSFVVNDVKEHLGNLEYVIPVARNGSLETSSTNVWMISHQHAYLKYFEEELRSWNGDWKGLISWHLFESSVPLIGGVIGGCKIF